MKKLQLFWGDSTQNKVISIFILLIISCCILAVCMVAGTSVWLFFSGTPATSAPPPAYPTETRLPIPTFTALPANPTQDVNQEIAYMEAVKIATGEISDLWNEFNIFISYVRQYPDALDDAQWVNEFKVLLNEMDEAAEKLNKLPPAPERFTDLHRILLEFSTFNHDFTRVMRQYLDTQDETLINEIIPLQEKIIELQSRLEAEVEELEKK